MAVGNLSPFHQMCCEKCYTTGNNRCFTRCLPSDPWVQKGTIKRGIGKEGKDKHQNNLDLHEARDGYHLLVPFECSLYIFKKVRGKHPIENTSHGNLLTVYIRHIHLDAFWSWTRLTVQQNT